MSESSQHSRIAKLVQDIIEACKNDPTRMEVAIANFDCLIKAMRQYELAPRYYNAALEDPDPSYTPPGQPNIPISDKGNNDPYKYPVVGELEKIFGKKLRQSELQKVGKFLAQKIGLRLDRETKRSKPMLIQWFSAHWETLHSKIYEFGGSKMLYQ